MDLLQRAAPSAALWPQILEDAGILRAKYWQALPIQVRCYRRAGRTEEANHLVSYMAKIAAALRTQPGPAYQEALDTLARLTAEGKESSTNADIGRAVPLKPKTEDR